MSQDGGIFVGALLLPCYNVSMSKNQPAQSAQDIEFTRKTIHEGEITGHVEHISREFREGFEFIKKYPKSVTIFGSSMLGQDSEACLKARELGARIAKDLGYAVVTGGGPGIMEAANRGASDAHGKSVGLNVSIPREGAPNGYLTDHMKFSYFFSRKTLLSFAAETYVFFPGGFGTFDELFGILTLIQTKKIHQVPIVLFDSKFWNPIIAMMKDVMIEKFQTIDPGDLGLFEVTDSIERTMEIISKAQVSEWWRKIN